MPAPKVFISYSHDSSDHMKWALRLATSLREFGVDATLDQWDLVPGQDIAAFMADGIRTADRVVMICTDPYVAKAEAGKGGVGYERLIVTAEVVAKIDTIKFIPIVRNNAGERKVPIFLGPRLYIDFSDDAQYGAKIEVLAREILAAPASVKPGLGENPFKGEVIEAGEPVRVAGPSGMTAAGEPILSGEWFEDRRATSRPRRGHFASYTPTYGSNLADAAWRRSMASSGLPWYVARRSPQYLRPSSPRLSGGRCGEDRQTRQEGPRNPRQFRFGAAATQIKDAVSRDRIGSAAGATTNPRAPR